MPNSSQQTAESKPKARKTGTKPKESAGKTASSKNGEAAVSKTTRSTKAPGSHPSDALPKTPRKRAPRSAAAGMAAETPVSLDAGTAPEAAPNKTQILTEVTYEMIAVRAYFLAENRRAHGGNGDPSGDWLEAERQLRAEAAAIAASLNQKL